MTAVLTAREADGLIGRITLEGTGNAMTVAAAAAMSRALAEYAADDVVKVVVIDAAGPDLTLGYDAAEAEAVLRAAPGGTEGKVPSQRARLIAADTAWWGSDGLFHRLLHSRKVTILAAKGRCFDAGLHLALCADLVVADSTARFACPRWRHVGVSGDISLLVAAVGLKRAKEMIYAGAEWDALKARWAGLLDEVVSPGALTGAVTELAQRCALVMRDAITAEKQVVFASLAKMGVGVGFAAATVLGGWGTNVHHREGEFNFLREAREHGVDSALARADAYYADAQTDDL